jgi:hypothetical protein
MESSALLWYVQVLVRTSPCAIQRETYSISSNSFRSNVPIPGITCNIISPSYVHEVRRTASSIVATDPLSTVLGCRALVYTNDTQ